MKQELGRLRATAEQEEIYGVHSEGVYEIVPSGSCIDESKGLTQTRFADVLHKTSLWMSVSLSKQGENH